jgi:hypothetical protein
VVVVCSTIRPAYITAMRWATWAMTPKLCEIKTMANAESLPEIGQEVEDLGLNRHVERGGGLVGEHEVRLA